MGTSLLGAAIACAVGAAIAVMNDRLTKAVGRKNPSLLLPFFAVRQLVNVLYLAALYFLAPVLPWDRLPLLIGGALGITVPAILLALRFAKQQPASANKSEEGDGK